MATVYTCQEAREFTGDGRADYAVYRPTTGEWWVLPGPDGSNATRRVWGTSLDVPLRGDYDGDGRDDIAVYRPTQKLGRRNVEGQWLIQRSSDQQIVTGRWGSKNDLPVAGDYDNDRIADFAVWRPSTGHWFIIRSGWNASSNTPQVILKQFGLPGDHPVPSDLSRGDVTATSNPLIAVWRPSTGAWYVCDPLNDGFCSSEPKRLLGQPGDVPVPGDYIGAHDQQPAVWRPATGMWIRHSGSATAETQWGLPGDLPVASDIKTIVERLRVLN